MSRQATIRTPKTYRAFQPMRDGALSWNAIVIGLRMNGKAITGSEILDGCIMALLFRSAHGASHMLDPNVMYALTCAILSVLVVMLT